MSNNLSFRRSLSRIGASVAVVVLASLCSGSPLRAAEDEKKPADKNAAKVTYVDHVQPIFREKCFSCHNTDKKIGGLDLSTYSAAMAGGSSGTVIEPGATADSHLWALVNHDSEPFMPPKSDKLPAEMLATISKWIDGGAL
ncbi:MAG: c-type cytochrome domain-containing protein, partial [Planctomycetaceae bacterium]